MAFTPQDEDTNDSDPERDTLNRARQALTALVRALARGAASEFLLQYTNENKHDPANIED
jgi:hypothetical protein